MNYELMNKKNDSESDRDSQFDSDVEDKSIDTDSDDMYRHKHYKKRKVKEITEVKSGNITPTKLISPSDVLKGGKRKFESPDDEPRGFPKRQKLDDLEELYRTMVADISQANNSINAWTSLRNSYDFLTFPK